MTITTQVLRRKVDLLYPDYEIEGISQAYCREAGGWNELHGIKGGLTIQRVAEIMTWGNEGNPPITAWQLALRRKNTDYDWVYPDYYLAEFMEGK